LSGEQLWVKNSINPSDWILAHHGETMNCLMTILRMIPRCGDERVLFLDRLERLKIETTNQTK
jgi:hypothetical protein